MAAFFLECNLACRWSAVVFEQVFRNVKCGASQNMVDLTKN